MSLRAQYPRLSPETGQTALLGTASDPSGFGPALSHHTPSWEQKFLSVVDTGLKNLTEPTFMVPMIAAQGAFGLGRWGLLKLFPQALSRGGALVAANVGAFGLEGLAYLGSERGLRHALGDPATVEQSFAKDLAHTYLTMGLLRGLGSLSSAALQFRLQNISSTHWLWQDRFLQKAIPQAASFGGIFLSHTLAPYLGLADPMAWTDRLAQSAVSLVHFEMAGSLMNRIPGYGAANQRIHDETQRLLQGKWDGLLPASIAVTPEGIGFAIPKGEDTASSLIVKINSSEESKGERPSVPPSIPPPPSLPPWGPNSVRQSLPPPNGKGNGHGDSNGNGNGNGGKTKLKARVGGLGQGAKLLSKLEILNRFSPPDQKPLEVNRKYLPEPVRSVDEGKLLAMSRGLGQRQVWHIRRILDHTRDLPETRKAYLEVERARIAFHHGLKKLVDPILKKFRNPSLSNLQYGIEGYYRAIEQVLGRTATDYQADALLNLAYAQQIHDPKIRAELGEVDLISMGFEPKAVEWAKTNGGEFWPGALEALIQGHPELASAPGAADVIEAARNFRLEPLKPENLSEMGHQLKAMVESYGRNLSAGQLTLTREQLVLWDKIRETCESFHPEKITGPDGEAAQKEILAAKQANKKPPRTKQLQDAADAAVATGDALFHQIEDFLRGIKDQTEWEALKKAKDDFPAPETYLSRRNSRLIKKLTRYLKNDSIAALWVSETAVHNSLRELMRRPSENFLSEALQEAQGREMDRLSAEDKAHLTEVMQNFRIASEAFQLQKLWARSRRFSNIHGLLDGLARLVDGKDYSKYYRAESQYQHAIQDILVDYESFLIPAARRVLEKRLQAIKPEGLEELKDTRERLMNWYEDLAQQYRDIFKEMEPDVSAFLDFYDSQMVGLREKGMRVGLTHLKELAQTIHEKVPNEKLFNDLLIKTLEWEKQLEELIHGKPGEERGKPLDPNKKEIIGYRPAAERGLKGMLNPRDFQRNIEEPVKLLMKRYLDLPKIAQEHGVHLGKIHPMLPIFEPYVYKYELVQELRERLPFLDSIRLPEELPRLAKPKDLRDLERVRRMARYLYPAIVRVFRIGSMQYYGYPFKEGARLFLDFGALVGKSANPQTFYLQKGIEDVARYFHFTLSADHHVHLDFIGNAGNVVQALLGPNYAHGQSIPDIIAKLDLEVPFVDSVFPYLTNMIGNQKHHQAMAIHRASRMQALGELEFERMEPLMPLGYDKITMEVAKGEGAYVLDPASPITASIPVMGRLFGIAEGAAVLTGRPQGITFVQDPGELRNFPAQRATDYRMAALLNNPTSFVTLFMPATALPEPKGMGKITYRNNLERLIWYLQAFHPELDPGAPETDAIFYEKYKKPLDPETERIVADLFAELGEHYPSAQSMKALEAKREELNVEGDGISSYRKLGLIDEALDHQTRQMLSNRLTVLDQLLTRELQTYPDISETKGLRRRQRMIQARLKILEQVEQKAVTGEALSLTEKKFLAKAQAYYTGKTTVEARDPLIDQVEYYFSKRYPDRDLSKPQQAHPRALPILHTMETVIDLVKISGWQHKQEILKILKNRQQKLIEAFTRYNLGEPLTPVDQILIENMTGSVSREENPQHQDDLISAIMYNHVKPERLEKVLQAEKIRERQRALIEKLPGGGRGTIDPIRESTEDLGKVKFDSAGKIVAGSKGYLATYNILTKFLGYATSLGILGGLDYLTGGKFDFYTWASPFIARHATRSVDWRPFSSAQDVRALEDIQIEAAGLVDNEGPRPIAIASGHFSWFDIIAIMAYFPKMRFAYKKELLGIPFLNLALIFGRHTGIDRPKDNSPEERERAFAQVKKSGEQMVETGLAPTFFHSGTRSLTGIPGAPKDGIAHLAMPTNALILGISLFGTRQILGNGPKAFSEGMGVDRKIGISCFRVDPREIVDLDAVVAQRNNIKATVKAGKQISGRIHQRITDHFIQQFNFLRDKARSGDAMAQAQLAEQMAAIEEGMNLIRKGAQTPTIDDKTGELTASEDFKLAKDWAKKNKTDFDTLKKITEWWDGNSASAE